MGYLGEYAGQVANQLLGFLLTQPGLHEGPTKKLVFTFWT